jgi:rubrerythrin
MNKNELDELLYQALETELGGIQIYKAAIECAVNEDLKEEWTKYLDQTSTHKQILLGVLDELGLDSEAETEGRKVVRSLGEALIRAIKMAGSAGNPEAAQIVAAECIVLAETKDHLNWELIGTAAEAVKGDAGKALREAFEKVENEEDEHLYHTAGWTRELWIKSLGMPAVIPPPEEEKDVKTAIGAARAKHARKEML